MKLIALKAAGVLGAVRHSQLPFAMAAATLPVTAVTAAVRVPGRALAMELAVDKVTFVTQAGVIFVSAVTGFNTAQPLAVVKGDAGKNVQLADQSELLARFENH